jgi:hypothetical protein
VHPGRAGSCKDGILHYVSQFQRLPGQQLPYDTDLSSVGFYGPVPQRERCSIQVWLLR